jgi:hypothetical protein
MSEIMRICAQCGKSSPLEARYCPHCGFDAETGVVGAMEKRQLPVAITRAALPVLAGAASLVLRAAWKLWQRQLTNAALRTTSSTPQRQSITRSTSEPLQRPRRTIRIRSSWAVGDSHGILRQGSSDHTIEIED